MLNRSVLRFWVQARPGATGCVYEIAFTFYGIKFPLPHLDMPGLGQGFKVYNRYEIAHNIDRNPEYPTHPIG
jgi:hypothetical protein